MTIKEFRAYFINELALIYDVMECESFFYLILQNKFKKDRLFVALNPDLLLDNDAILEWNFFIKELKKEIPIQYLLGECYFYGLQLEVNENVLIPRPETEELVEWIIKDHSELSNVSPLNLLDIGTGSGCIAIALSKNIVNAQVSALDVSEAALETAKINASNLGVSLSFLNKDIRTLDTLDKKYDVIVSNPPYIRNLEKAEIKKNVLDYEPHLALFVSDDDPLVFYRKIAQLAYKSLNENGFLYFEINQYLGSDMVDLLEGLAFKNIIVKKDIYGNDRMIRASLK